MHSGHHDASRGHSPAVNESALASGQGKHARKCKKKGDTKLLVRAPAREAQKGTSIGDAEGGSGRKRNALHDGAAESDTESDSGDEQELSALACNSQALDPLRAGYAIAPLQRLLQE